MKRESIYQDGIFIGARYIIEHAKFGKNNYKDSIYQLTQITSELPIGENLEIKNFSFKHSFYDLDIAFGFIPKTQEELINLLNNLIEKDDLNHRLFCGVFLPGSELEFKLK
jgi:hypothetical protein